MRPSEERVMSDDELILTFLHYFSDSSIKSSDARNSEIVKYSECLLKRADKGWQERLLHSLVTQYPSHDYEIIRLQVKT